MCCSEDLSFSLNPDWWSNWMTRNCFYWLTFLSPLHLAEPVQHVTRILPIDTVGCYNNPHTDWECSALSGLHGKLTREGKLISNHRYLEMLFLYTIIYGTQLNMPSDRCSLVWMICMRKANKGLFKFSFDLFQKYKFLFNSFPSLLVSPHLKGQPLIAVHSSNTHSCFCTNR